MNSTTAIKLARLAAPFPPKAVHWRIGVTSKNSGGQPERGLALAYLDARDVMDRFDLVLGQNAWQCRHEFHQRAEQVMAVCHIGVRLDDHWVWKSDAAGEAQMEGVKAAASDSQKRAAVQWGVGRYLYRLSSPWVQLTRKGRSTVIAEAERPKLLQILADAIYDASPVCGMRVDADGNELMDRATLARIYEMAELRLVELSVKGIKVENLLSELLADTPWRGATMRDLAMAPKKLLAELAPKINDWKPRDDAPDF